MTHIKYKLRDVRTPTDLLNWWNTVVDVRVKAIVVTATLLLFTIAGFQYQINAQTEARLDAQCQIRIESRDDLRKVLTAMVDLSDVLPGNPEAEAYTANRLALIDAQYPPITEEDCA